MSMRGKRTQLATGRKDLLGLLLRTLRSCPRERRRRRRGGQTGSVSTRPSPAGGAGPKDARAPLRRPFGPRSLSAQAEAWPLGAGTSPGGGSSGVTREQEPAERGDPEAPAATSTRAAAGSHPGSAAASRPQAGRGGSRTQAH